jgi:mono/diheme cytochrome c family protein
MSSRTTAWLAAFGLVFAPGPGRAADKGADAAAAAKGEITYVRYCVSCHGPSAKGDGPLAADLRVAVPDLTGMAARSRGAYPYDRVTRIIASGEVVRGHGSADMPAWGDAFKKTQGTGEASVDAAVRNLNHYLWSIQRPAK